MGFEVECGRKAAGHTVYRCTSCTSAGRYDTRTIAAVRRIQYRFVQEAAQLAFNLQLSIAPLPIAPWAYGIRHTAYVHTITTPFDQPQTQMGPSLN